MSKKDNYKKKLSAKIASIGSGALLISTSVTGTAAVTNIEPSLKSKQSDSTIENLKGSNRNIKPVLVLTPNDNFENGFDISQHYSHRSHSSHSSHASHSSHSSHYSHYSSY